MNSNSYVGCKISLISKSEIRYEGILQSINSNEATVTLENVRSFGSEGRRGGFHEIPASPQIYELIVFKGTDIRDLQVCEAPPQPQQMAPPSYFGSNYQQPYAQDEYYSGPGSFYSSNQMYSNVPSYYAHPQQMSAAPSLVRNPSYVPGPSSFISNPSEFDSMWTPDSLSSSSGGGTFRQQEMQHSSLAQSHHFSASSLSSDISSAASLHNSTETTKEEKNVYFGFVKPKEQLQDNQNTFTDEMSTQTANSTQREESYSDKNQKNNFKPQGTRKGGSKYSQNNGEFDFERSNSFFVKEEPSEDTPKEQFYKKSSFFDNISCDSTKDHGSNEMGAMNRKQKFRQEMAVNRQTFGVAVPHSNNFKSNTYRNYNSQPRSGDADNVNRRPKHSGSFSGKNKERITGLPSSAEINDFQRGL